MTEKTWRANRTPVPPHPFAHSLAGEDLVFISGLVGFRPDGSVPETAGEQARFAMQAMAGLLEAEGSNLQEIVWFKPWVTRREDVPEVDAEIVDALQGHTPAGGALTIVELVDPAFLVEFEAVAQRGARVVPSDPPA